MPKFPVKLGDKLPPKKTFSNKPNDVLQSVTDAVQNSITIPAPVQPLLPGGQSQSAGFGTAPKAPAAASPAMPTAPAQPKPQLLRPPRVNIPQQKPADVPAPVPAQTGEAGQNHQASVINIFTAPGAQK